jgi:hypothetical protein
MKEVPLKQDLFLVLLGCYESDPFSRVSGHDNLFGGNGTARFKKHKQLFENKHLLLLRDIWWSKF